MQTISSNATSINPWEVDAYYTDGVRRDAVRSQERNGVTPVIPDTLPLAWLQVDRDNPVSGEPSADFITDTHLIREFARENVGHPADALRNISFNGWDVSFPAHQVINMLTMCVDDETLATTDWEHLSLRDFVLSEDGCLVRA